MHNVSRHGRVRPLLRTRVVLKVICSVDDGNAVVVAAGGGEEDLRRRKTVCVGERSNSKKNPTNNQDHGDA